MSFRFTFIQGHKVNRKGYVEVGLICADICRALDRGMNAGKRPDDLSPSVYETIDQLTTWV